MKRAFIGCALVLTASTLTVAGNSATASEVVYRWKDEAGNPVNSDRPPPKGIEYEVITTKSSMVRPVDAAEGNVPPNTKPQAGNESQPVAVTTPPVEKNAEYCRQAKDNLAALDSDVRIQMRNEKGEVYYLSTEERDVQRKKAVDTIKVNCDQ